MELEKDIRNFRGGLRRIRGLLSFSGRWQVGFSAVIGLAVIVYSLSIPRHHRPIMPTSTAYLAVVVALAAVLTLVSSLTFGILLFHLQGIIDQRSTLYDRYLNQVRDLREALERLNKSGIIDKSYDQLFVAVETISINEFPLDDWDERIMPIADLVMKSYQNEARYGGKYYWACLAIVGRLANIETTANGISGAWVSYILLQIQTLSPVLKSFRTLAIMACAILILPFTTAGPLRSYWTLLQLVLGV